MNLGRLDYKTLFLSLLISYGCVWWLLSFLMQSVMGNPEPGVVQYSNALWVLMPAYLAVPPLLAGCMVARAASNRPMLHALIAAVVGAAVYATSFVLLAPIPLVLTAVGAGLYLRTTSKRPDRSALYIPPMRRALLLTALLFAGPTLAADYATCLLDKLPGVKNAPAHAAALNLCAHQPRGGAH